jgi:ATP-dependent RNA helicase DeaD
MSQRQRDVAMGRFRNGSTTILIATDVAARGIDVDDVEAVINYDIPQDIEYYVHRIGRTGRAGRKGRSFTFVSGRDIYQLRSIERVCHTTIEEKKLPGASKVLKAKADKYLNQAWELHEHEDIELMKKFLERKMEEEGCDALELAASMLKLQVGDKGIDIEADDSASTRRNDRNSRGRDAGRGSRGRSSDNRHFDGRDRDRDRNRNRDRGGRRGSEFRSSGSGNPEYRGSRSNRKSSERDRKQDTGRKNRSEKNHNQ